MKKQFFLFIIMLLILPYISFSQSKSEKVRDRLIELFSLCKQDKFSEAASYIVYRGSDETRKWNDVYDSSNAAEMKEVKQVCIGIKYDLENGGDIEFAEFKTETESEGEWCIWKVQFNSGKKNKVYFAFLEINGKYCLGDID